MQKMDIRNPLTIVSYLLIKAAQLYGEFKEMSPENAVEYFVS